MIQATSTECGRSGAVQTTVALRLLSVPYIYWLLLAVSFFWGTSYGAAKIALRELEPLNLAILRFTLASLLFGAILAGMGAKSRLKRRDVPRFLVMGFMAITSFFYIQFTGLRYTTNAHAGLILGMTPVLVALYSAVLGMEKVSRRSLTGMALSWTGVGLIITQGQWQGLLGQGTLFGDVLILFNTLVWAGVTLYGAKLMQQYRPFVAMAYIHIFGTAMLLPFAVLPTPLVSVPLVHQLPLLTAPSYLAAGYLALFCSVYSYYMWYAGIEALGAVKTAIYSYFNPLFAVMTGIVWFGEDLTMSVAAGGLLVIAGVWMASRRRKAA